MGKVFTGRDGKVRARYAAIDRTRDDLRRLIEGSAAFEAAARKNHRGFDAHFSFMLGHLFNGLDIERTQLAAIVDEGAESRNRIARIILLCRFANAIYSTYRLASFGLIVDALSCLRSAFEALQYWRLLNVDDSYVNGLLDHKKRLRPAAVRKALGAAAHSIDAAASMYSDLSDITHIGGDEFLVFDETEDGQLAIRMGGVTNPEAQGYIYQDILTAMHQWVGYAMGLREEEVKGYFEAVRSAGAQAKSRDERFKLIADATLTFLKEHRGQGTVPGSGGEVVGS